MAKLPEVMPFEGVNGRQTLDCYWRYRGVGCPKKGEYYVSGAIPMAYKAPNNLSRSFMIVEPTHYAKLVTKHERGEMVPASRR